MEQPSVSDLLSMLSNPGGQTQQQLQSPQLQSPAPVPMPVPMLQPAYLPQPIQPGGLQGLQGLQGLSLGVLDNVRRALQEQAAQQQQQQQQQLQHVALQGMQPIHLPYTPFQQQQQHPEPLQFEPLIRHLRTQQDELETRLLEERSQFVHAQDQQRDAIFADEMVGKLTATQVAGREAALARELQRFDHRLFERMEAMRRSQQDAMQKAGMAGFKVTDDAHEIANQIWHLAPFVLLPPSSSSSSSL
ncbi:hypothetical protein BC831DRAFT_514152 [Entophlyctis helioformis]|nr:hypothetical protein BC831DRAFT_514152 [Entophlyctis helioformis]